MSAVKNIIVIQGGEVRYGSNRSGRPLEYLFKFGLLLIFLESWNAWFTWKINPFVIPAVTVIFCLPYLIYIKSSLSFGRKTIIPIVLLIIAKVFSVPFTNVNGLVGAFLTIVPVILIIPLSGSYKKEILRFFTNATAVILFLSVGTWILVLAGYTPLSFGHISNPAWEMYVYDNYFFCLRNIPLYNNRFCGIFLEPGHLGMIVSFLLFANKFDMKRKAVWVFLVAVLFTLSLAAYVLTLIAFSLYVMIYSRRILVYLVIWIAALVGGYAFFTSYNSGNNAVNKKIIERLQYDQSTGDIQGDNRSTKKFDNYYFGFLNRDEVLWGIGGDRFQAMKFGPNAGYKVFIVLSGVVDTVLVFLFYLSLVFYSKRTKFAWALLLIYVLAFLQRAYPFWACELLIFITALPIGEEV